MTYAPVFIKEGQKFLLAYEQATSEQWLDAYSGGSELESNIGARYNFKFSGEIVDLDTAKVVIANLGDLGVLLVSGPLYDEVVERAANE